MDIQKVNVYVPQGVFCGLKTIQLNREEALLASVHQTSQAIAACREGFHLLNQVYIHSAMENYMRTETTDEDALFEYSYFKCVSGESRDVTYYGCYPEAEWRI